MRMALYIIVGIVLLILVLAIGIKPKEEPLIDYSWSDNLDPACITVDDIVNKEEDVLVVFHDYGQGGWQFLDGKDVANRKPTAIEKVEMLKIDSSIIEILDLEVGWKAERASKNDMWVRSKIE